MAQSAWIQIVVRVQRDVRVVSAKWRQCVHSSAPIVSRISIKFRSPVTSPLFYIEHAYPITNKEVLLVKVRQ